MCLNDRLQPELNDSCGWETLVTVAKIFSISDKVVYLGFELYEFSKFSKIFIKICD